ncbi:hypothetical protein KL86DES1_22070 [uncultured Desulfovibrio sp.]|uniref:Uncharacterized protein n=1 Tax=uncultured Desulfovibrio sp. TaxID=167968 RepID=A0A212LAQ9_9BACT|nr:hypothetical protein KL86DES1_22070 [uncultured Desulfovibrio sp.]VZH34964.1 conserved protein of unknown function [Desulfovibrio sp. 86]
MPSCCCPEGTGRLASCGVCALPESWGGLCGGWLMLGLLMYVSLVGELLLEMNKGLPWLCLLHGGASRAWP